MCRLSVIIPTYKRPADLQRTLSSLLQQNHLPEEIIVVIGPNDKESLNICRNVKQEFVSLCTIQAYKPSLVHALNLGLASAKEDIICLLDDDVWLPAGWSEKIKQAYRDKTLLGAYGGRDRLQLNIPYFDNPEPAKEVGTFKWNGILTGNHHRGSVISPVSIDVLKGVNLSFKRGALTPLQIEPKLESFGAETCTEIDVCLRIKKAGYDVIYDNDNYVLHYASTRSTEDDRSNVFAPASLKRAYNQALITAKYRPYGELFFFIVRSLILGNRANPGIVHSAILFRRYRWRAVGLFFKNFQITLQAAREGLRIRKQQ